MSTGKYLSLERSGIIGKSRDYNDYCCLWWCICTSCHAGRRRCGFWFYGNALQQSGNWHSSLTVRQITPGEEVLGYSWDHWSLWQNSRPDEKERCVDYGEVNKKTTTEMQTTKETWIEGQCQEMAACVRKNNNNQRTIGPVSLTWVLRICLNQQV